METRDALFTQLLRLGDDCLILSHRLSEWCGDAPMLEEDLAMPNMALDLLGQARALYTYAGEVEGKGRGEDDFAFHRVEREFRNCLLVARPNGDFAQTMLRQLYFAAYLKPFWEAAQASTDETVAGIAGKSVKEIAYHIRHAGEWVIRLGDGTDESARRMAEAVEELAPYVDELFQADEVTEACVAAGFIPCPAALRPAFDAVIAEVFGQALLEAPENVVPMSGGRRGFHQEWLGHLLAQMQYLPRAYPNATW